MSEEKVLVTKDFEVSKKTAIIDKTSNITSINVGGTKVSIEDNFVSKDEFKKLQEQYLGNSLTPWYWSDHKIKGSHNDESSEFYSLNDYQLVHSLFNAQTNRSGLPAIHSPEIEHMSCILKRLPMYALLRLKLNLNPRTETHWISGFHTDSVLDNITSVFYLNTCNGSTVFEEGGEVESVENRLVTFPSNLRHASKSATNVKARYVLNINYFPLTQDHYDKEPLLTEERFVSTDPKFLE